MKDEVKRQIRELTRFHKGLTDISRLKRETLVKGGLSFEASQEDLPTISGRFDIELAVPEKYPKILPCVRETGGAIDRDYGHINSDGTLCLAAPVESRRIFSEQNSLLGFVNRLVIPYLYGYCYWKKYGRHPFGEQAHGAEGIVHYYMDELGLDSSSRVLAMVSFLLEHGYRGHLDCPCGSGLKVRNCHGRDLLSLSEHHTKDTLKNDFRYVLDFCLKNEKETIPKDLLKRIERIVGKKRHRLANGSPVSFSKDIGTGLFERSRPERLLGYSIQI